MTKCNHKVPCGCGDNALTTQAACGTGLPNCPTPDPCPETFCAGCVVYCGEDIVDLGIRNGDRMDTILQLMALNTINPGCAGPRSTSGAILGYTPGVVGAGYTPGTYVSVPLLSGTGTGATADIIVSGGGVITNIIINNPGIGYSTGDVLYPDPLVVGIPTTISTIIVIIEACRSVAGLYSTSSTSSQIALAWQGEPSALSYQIEYKRVSDVSWTLTPMFAPVVNPTYTIGALVSNSDYYIRVNNIGALCSCYSVTILVKTK